MACPSGNSSEAEGVILEASSMMVSVVEDDDDDDDGCDDVEDVGGSSW